MRTEANKDGFIEFLKPMSIVWSSLSGGAMVTGFIGAFAWFGSGGKFIPGAFSAIIGFAASAAFQSWASAHLVVINRAEDRERWDKLQKAIAEKLTPGVSV